MEIREIIRGLPNRMATTAAHVGRVVIGKGHPACQDDEGDMQIVRLIPREVATLDPRRIKSIARRHGPDQAEGVVVGSLEELGRHLRRLDDDYRSGDPDRLTARIRAVITLSDQIGMRHVARVATDVARCSNAGDEAALAATLSRLMRLMTQALDDIAVEPVPF